MKTSTEIQSLFTNEIVNEYANMLLNAGFDIIKHEDKDVYFSYHKDNKVGYFQYHKFDGPTISTVHKPCKECGTGFRVVESKVSEDYTFIPLTIKDFEAGFAFAPYWASERDRKAIKKYESLAEYMKLNVILKKPVIYSTKEQTS